MKQHKSEHISHESSQQQNRMLWAIWMGVMVIAVCALPFIVRQSELAQSFIQLCMGAIGVLS